MATESIDGGNAEMRVFRGKIQGQWTGQWEESAIKAGVIPTLRDTTDRTGALKTFDGESCGKVDGAKCSDRRTHLPWRREHRNKIKIEGWNLTCI